VDFVLLLTAAVVVIVATPFVAYLWGVCSSYGKRAGAAHFRDRLSRRKRVE
jgi:hypothetical protein